MNNSSNLSKEFVELTHDQSAYGLIIVFFFLTPAFIFNIILAVFIVSEKTLPGSIRLVLTNILATCELVILGMAVILVKSTILSTLLNLLPSDFVCRLLYVIMASGASARLLFMATFSVTVYILVESWCQQTQISNNVSCSGGYLGICHISKRSYFLP